MESVGPKRVLFGFVFLLGLPTLSVAGSFAVNPVRLSLSSERLVDAIRVTNQGAEDAILQVETTAWTQVDGKDVYTTTDDLLVNPPIFTVAAGSAQIVRIGFPHEEDFRREQAYRVFFQEVPPPTNPDFKGLRVLLRMGVPVFLKASDKSASALEWQATAESGSRVNITASNPGNTHVRVIRLSVYTPEGRILAARTLSDTLLAEKSREWSLELEEPPSNGEIRIVAETSDGSMDSGIIALASQ